MFNLIELSLNVFRCSIKRINYHLLEIILSHQITKSPDHLITRFSTSR